MHFCQGHFFTTQHKQTYEWTDRQNTLTQTDHFYNKIFAKLLYDRQAHKFTYCI